MSWGIIKKNNQTSKPLSNNSSNAELNLGKLSLGKLSQRKQLNQSELNQSELNQSHTALSLEKLSESNLKSSLVNKSLRRNADQNLQLESSKYLIKNFGAVAVGISANVDFSGNLFFECPVIIYGKFKGFLSSSSTIIIAETAEMSGQIEAQKIIVFGNIESDLYAKELIELMPRSKVAGTILSKSLKMHSGSELSSEYSKISQTIVIVSKNQNLTSNSIHSSQSNFDFSLIEEVCYHEASIRQFGDKQPQSLITADTDEQITLSFNNSVDEKSNTKVRKINKFSAKQNKLLSEQYVLPC
jgi:cytoskeletal protein CcmA (bactofilin family)